MLPDLRSMTKMTISKEVLDELLNGVMNVGDFLGD
jgi:hypothetical protein